ncbi:transporter [Bacillus horti]|uniref:Citrate transporter n=1 Tax=Caldalkalibacillus horti TaxID=77523 RepID=A0ABT9W3B0_9BACI|nr:transporter [Bacillus horti]MDQ0167733.1 hypothetical protein [Bacillus horti]
MSLLMNSIPLIVIIVLLYKRQHMLFAGLVGGVLAFIIGGLTVDQATSIFVGGISNMLGITIPIIYAAAAMMVSKAGSIQALVELASRGIKGKVSILAGVIVLIQAFATYMAGMGAGNTMVTAPLMAMAVGANPFVIAAMSIATAVGFTTSPASTETILAAESAGLDVITHASAMLPYTMLFYLLAAGLAIYGVHKNGALINQDGKKEEQNEKTNNWTLLKQSIPAVALLVMVLAGNSINSMLEIKIFTPASIVIITAVLTVLLTPLNINKTGEALVDGSKFILTTLFGVGIFLGFINMIGELGTFAQIAALANNVPNMIVLPVAMILAFLIAIPSGAMTAGVLTLILPTLAALGLPPLAMGFVAIATGLGTQISPVQINVAALADGFKLDIIDIIKGNMKFVLGALALLIVIAMIVV